MGTAAATGIESRNCRVAVRVSSASLSIPRCCTLFAVGNQYLSWSLESGNQLLLSRVILKLRQCKRKKVPAISATVHFLSIPEPSRSARYEHFLR